MKKQNCKANAASGLLSIVAGMLIAFLLLLTPQAAQAQNYAGSVRGTVTDPSGAGSCGATVTLRNVGNNETLTATTTATGAYSFAAVNVGTYELKVKAAELQRGRCQECGSTRLDAHRSKRPAFFGRGQ